MPPFRRPPTQGFLSAVASRVTKAAGLSAEAERMLPSSKGDETPEQLQRYRTEVYSYFTESSNETQLLYSAENWVHIKLELETAGPVAIGTTQDIVPVLSGRGILLETAETYEADLAKGTRVYITSQTVNRISIQIAPIPWLEQIDADTVSTNNGIRDMVSRGAKAIINAIDALRGMAKPTSSSGVTAQDQPMPTVPGQRLLVPRLTGVPGPKKMR